MKWYKHDTTANMDDRLQEVLLDYGLEGYGLYWYCLELIALNVTPENLNFELKHDARIIARNTGCTVQKVEEMMTRFIDIGLFEADNGHITCLKLAKRADDYTAKLVRLNRTQAIENKEVRETPTKSEKVPSDKNRLEENRSDKNNKTISLSDIQNQFDDLYEKQCFHKTDKARAFKHFKKLVNKMTPESCKAFKEMILMDMWKRFNFVNGRPSDFKQKLVTYLSSQTWEDEDMPNVYDFKKSAIGNQIDDNDQTWKIGIEHAL